ncbi:protein bicaudal D [Daktulosphaira vitifoliae]|uniref:protein bicaudal D n=1 Tax=Daktulosphaira vitifoliae TaxID=58002 RepID=UPI0021AA9FC7|nr:protein bicaudal D [Daktulosphaira vitifoliae]
MEISELHQEINRLTRELDQAQTEKIQSATYGLSLLEEKQTLTKQYEELENLYESVKQELDITQEALNKFQTSHKVTTKSGIEQEESLLYETAALESSLNTTIIELENDTKLLRQELDRVRVERDRAIQDNNDLIRQSNESNHECKQLRSELREIKSRETHLLSDYSELEEENITLQKQIAHLKSSQVEFEGAKHEIRRLQENVELLYLQVDELAKLKKIAEKQMEEALQSLQGEREAKYALKKELDQRINNESVYNLSNLAFSIRGMSNDQNISSDDEEDLPTLKKLENDISSTMNLPESGKHDLFSEIHLNELKKLEKQLEQVESEKSLLTQNLKESQLASDKCKNDLENLAIRIYKLGSHIRTLEHLGTQTNNKLVKNKSDNGKPNSSIEDYQQWFSSASKEVDQLHLELEDLESQLKSSDETLSLKDELIILKNKLIDREQKTMELESNVRLLGELATDASASLDNAQNDLVVITDELSQLVHQVSIFNGKSVPLTSITVKSTKEVEENDPRLDILRARLKSDVFIKELESLTEATFVAKSLRTVLDQIKLLKESFNNTIENAKSGNHENNENRRNIVMDSNDELFDLREQVMKLQSLLATKREQISSLRMVLKTNKNTAEVALNNLKSKYDNEKMVVTDTMTKLRNELRVLKEDAATFSSLRAMFAARCEEQATHMDDLQRQLAAAEEEKKTLNQLLRLAVQQKLMVTQRLEEIEMDRELKNVRRSMGTPNNSTPSKSSKRYNQSQRRDW